MIDYGNDVVFSYTNEVEHLLVQICTIYLDCSGCGCNIVVFFYFDFFIGKISYFIHSKILLTHLKGLITRATCGHSKVKEMCISCRDKSLCAAQYLKSI